MAIPDYQTLMLPLLKLAGDGAEHSVRDAVARLADEFELSKNEREMPLPSGRQAIFDNRIGWARTYLSKAGLLTYPRRGALKITARGIEVLKRKPSKIDITFLSQFPEFVSFRTAKADSISDGNLFDVEVAQRSPEESLEYGHLALKKNLSDELLAKIKSCSPKFFEQLVVDLLLKMGYGGDRIDAGEAIGRTNDEGIDGIIKEDKLGLDSIYIQAKRWQNTVGRGELQRFVGALQGKRAKKGVFITTADFADTAHQYAAGIDIKVVLIDGERPANLMIEYGLGVSPAATYEVKRLDSDYFTEE